MLRSYRKKNVEILHNAKTASMEVTFSGFISYEELLAAIDYEFAMIRHYGLKKCLVDLLEILVYPIGGQEYIKTVWFPKLIQLGIQVVAFVVPDDFFLKISIAKAHKNEFGFLQIRYFTNAQQAQSWIAHYIVPVIPEH